MRSEVDERGGSYSSCFQEFNRTTYRWVYLWSRGTRKLFEARQRLSSEGEIKARRKPALNIEPLFPLKGSIIFPRKARRLFGNSYTVRPVEGAGAPGERGLTPNFDAQQDSSLHILCRKSSTSNNRNMDDLPPEQVAVLRKAFDAFDRDHSGSIPTDMVADILRLMGQPFNKKILDELIEEVDADKSGRLEFEEFVTLAAKFIVEEDDEAMQKELREAFRLYDKEGNGYIPTSCLKEILHELDEQLTNEELDMIIEEIDSDGSGTVDFDEFMEMMTGE